jgi:hypothetical protein
MKRFSVSLLMIVMLLWLTGGLQSAWADGPYRGKVIDAETKEPIEGAVVVAVWMKNQFGITESHEVFAEAKEALTDKDGEFVIPGYKWTSIFFYFGIQPPQIYIFKAGYGDFPWHQISPNPKQSNAALLEPFKTHALVELSKVKSREERLAVYHDYSLLEDYPHEKVLNLIKMKNIEGKNLGFNGEEK